MLVLEIFLLAAQKERKKNGSQTRKALTRGWRLKQRAGHRRETASVFQMLAPSLHLAVTFLGIKRSFERLKNHCFNLGPFPQIRSSSISHWMCYESNFWNFQQYFYNLEIRHFRALKASWNPIYLFVVIMEAIDHLWFSSLLQRISICGWD